MKKQFSFDSFPRIGGTHPAPIGMQSLLLQEWNIPSYERGAAKSPGEEVQKDGDTPYGCSRCPTLEAAALPALDAGGLLSPKYIPRHPLGDSHRPAGKPSRAGELSFHLVPGDV